MNWLSLVDPVDAVKRKVLGGIGLAALMAIAALGGWGARVDHLRARYADRLNSVRIVLKDVGFGAVQAGAEANTVKLLGAQRDQYLSERDQARTLVGVQSASIDRLHGEEAAAQREAEANRKLLAAAVKERDTWIARARAAETRTERLSAEQEVAECEAVLDDLRAKGF
jgi:hypothetical protein